ncbi:MAG: galactose-1-phosphate uridylyltransferase, partial [Lachnospiraceae bacterium]|nr:galactose-1-phosphate uridylyltransferase [Lachnospiraceae bacterium]
MEISKLISKLVKYGIITGLVEKEDIIYTTNRLLMLFKVDEAYEGEVGEVKVEDLETILKGMLDYAYENKLMEDNSIVSRDLFDTKVMGCLVNLPSTIINKFNTLYKENPEKATNYFYKLSCDSDYIRRYRIKKDQKWVTSTEYGDLDITINLSKPEKDPIAISAAKLMKQSGFPKCLLCMENEGYAG